MLSMLKDERCALVVAETQELSNIQCPAVQLLQIYFKRVSLVIAVKSSCAYECDFCVGCGVEVVHVLRQEVAHIFQTERF